MIRTGEKKLAAYEKKTAEPPSTSSRLSVGVSIQSSAKLPTTSNGIIQSISREQLIARTSGRGIYRLTVCRAYVRWSGYCPTWRPDGDSGGMASRKKRAHARAPPKPETPTVGGANRGVLLAVEGDFATVLRLTERQRPIRSPKQLDSNYGRITASTTWMTPLVALMSVFTTFEVPLAVPTFTPPSVEIRSVPPPAVLASLSFTTSLA